MPVLVISHMGWLSYNKEYEVFRQIGGVVDHYVVATGFRNDEAIYVNDPHPEFHRKNAELQVHDFKIGWSDKLAEIQSIRCPMLVVTGKASKEKPEIEWILKRAIRRAVKQLNTHRGSAGLAGFKKAVKEVPRLLRKNTPAIRNSVGEYAFFTFRVASQNRQESSRFLAYSAAELNLKELEIASRALVDASKCYAELRTLFIECVEGRKETPQIADDVSILLNRAFNNETESVKMLIRAEGHR